MSLALSQAQAVAASLNAGTFDASFAAAAKFLPRRPEEATSTVTVDVIPAPQTRDLDTRASVIRGQGVAIVVDCSVEYDQAAGDFDAAQVDTVVSLAEAFCEHFESPANRALVIDGRKSTVLAAQIGDGLNLLDLELLSAAQLARCVVTVQLRVH